MTLLRLPTTRRGYLLGAIAGVITTVGTTAAGRLLIRLGLHAELTYLDDILVGVLVAMLVLVLRGNHDLERNREHERFVAMVATHRAIAADMQMIAQLTTMPAVAAIASETAARIEAAVEELETERHLVDERHGARIQKALSRFAV